MSLKHKIDALVLTAQVNDFEAHQCLLNTMRIDDAFTSEQIIKIIYSIILLGPEKFDKRFLYLLKNIKEFDINKNISNQGMAVVVYHYLDEAKPYLEWMKTKLIIENYFPD